MRPARTEADRARWAVFATFAVFFAIGLLFHDDYGISWDEPDFYHYGRLLLRFYATGDRAFEEFSNLRWYGGAVALLHGVVGSPARAGTAGTAGAVNLAHLLNFVIFFGGVLAFYGLLLVQTKRRTWSLFGAAMLVLSPRVLSHGFVNPKDSPFMVAFIVTMYLLVLYLERRQTWVLALLGVVAAVMVDIRIHGLVGVAMAAAALVADAATGEAGSRLRSLFRSGAVFALAFLPPLVLLWPYLWPAPRTRLIETIQVMASFSGAGGAAYLGESVSTSQLPWHYVPVWIAITTPLPYVVLAVVGIVTKAVRAARSHVRLFVERSPDRHYLLYGAWLVGVPAVIVVRRSELYDEWRQLLFVYPALLIFAVAGGMAVESALRRRAPAAIAAAAVAALVPGALATARLHPYEALYFNALVGGVDGAERRFELDYWGMSYREGLRRLVDRMPGEIVLYPCTDPGRFNAVFLSPAERRRVRFVATPEEADVGICAPRESWIVDGHPQLLADYPTVLEIGREGGTFLYVKDLPGPPRPPAEQPQVSTSPAGGESTG